MESFADFEEFLSIGEESFEKVENPPCAASDHSSVQEVTTTMVTPRTPKDMPSSTAIFKDLDRLSAWQTQTRKHISLPEKLVDSVDGIINQYPDLSFSQVVSLALEIFFEAIEDEASHA